MEHHALARMAPSTPQPGRATDESTCRFSASQLAIYRERVAAEEPVMQPQDSPDRFERAETRRTVRGAMRPVTLWLDLCRQAEADDLTEVNTKTLATIIGDEVGRPQKVAKIFGPPRSGRATPQQRVYLFREVRHKALLLMISSITRRLAQAQAKELGGL